MDWPLLAVFDMDDKQRFVIESNRQKQLSMIALFGFIVRVKITNRFVGHKPSKGQLGEVVATAFPTSYVLF